MPAQLIHESFLIAKVAMERANRILFTTHERTDGDDLGSVLALALHAMKSGKDVTVAITGGVPQQLRYLAKSEIVVEDIQSNEHYDLLVISGCSVLDRVNNPNIANLNVPSINIDHHPDNSMFGTVNVVDADKSAVAELVYDFFKFSGWEIDAEIANCLLTGIVTDTGVFMHSNTKASTLFAAAELMQKGARVATVAKHTYQGKDVPSLKAWGKALENAQYDPEKKLVFSVITDDEFEDLDKLPVTAFEGVVENLNKVPEAKFAMFIKQDNGRIKGSLRGDPHKGVDVKEVAKTLGGGGHKWAAGFSMVGKLAKNSQGKWEIVKS